MSEVAHPTTIALPMKSPKMCSGVSHTPFMAAKRHVRRGWCVGRYYFVFAHLRAYAIRPYTCSIDFRVCLGSVSFSFSPTWGRMRYAPTTIHSKHGWIDSWITNRWINSSFSTKPLSPQIFYCPLVTAPATGPSKVQKALNRSQERVNGPKKRRFTFVQFTLFPYFCGVYTTTRILQ